jgi:hypothetical protein
MRDAVPVRVSACSLLPLTFYLRQDRFRSGIDWRWRLVVDPAVGVLTGLGRQLCTKSRQLRACYFLEISKMRDIVVMVHFVVVVVMDFLVWFFSGLSKEESLNTSRTDSRLRLSARREGVTLVVAGRPTSIASGTDVLHDESEQAGAPRIEDIQANRWLDGNS